MAEEDDSLRPAEAQGGATPNRDRRREAPIIEGEAVRLGVTDTAPPTPEAPNAAPIDAEPPPAPQLPAPSRASTAVLGALCGALAAAAMLWAYAAFLAPPDVSPRVAKLEAAAQAAPATLAALERRLQALEGPSGRLDALEAATKQLKIEAASAKASAAQLRDLRDQVDKSLAATGAPAAPPDLGALEARLASLEGAAASAQAGAAGGAQTEARIAKLEVALAAPKSESRVAPDAAKPAAPAAALAVAAQALGENFAAGAPYASEFAALSALGAKAEDLAALKPFAPTGAPTLAALGAEFTKLAPTFADPAPAADAGMLDRAMAELRSLVKVRHVGATLGDGPAALASQIGAALGANDGADALALALRLPEKPRALAQEWIARLQARQGAASAADALRADAMQALARSRS